jgi:hypothetical protein
MTTKLDLAARLKASTDTTFVPTSSTLMERLPDLAKASLLAKPARHARFGRRFAAAVGSIGIVGWLTMTSAGALVGISATGDLPDPIQQFVADVVETIGIDIPDPAEERLAEERRQSELDGSAPGLVNRNPEGPDSGASTSPGQSGNAPGLGGSLPGQSGNAPGLGGSSPGRRGSNGISSTLNP